MTLFRPLPLAGKRGVGKTKMQSRRLFALGIRLQEETQGANPARRRVLQKGSGARSNTLRGRRLHGGTLRADSRLSAVLLCVSTLAKSSRDGKDRYVDAKPSLFMGIGNNILTLALFCFRNMLAIFGHAAKSMGKAGKSRAISLWFLSSPFSNFTYDIARF